MRCRQCDPVPRRSAARRPPRGRWTVSILWASSEASRFNELKQAVGEIPPRTLAQRLVELEGAGLLERRVIDAPPRVEYALTPDGLRLRSVSRRSRRTRGV